METNSPARRRSSPRRRVCSQRSAHSRSARAGILRLSRDLPGHRLRLARVQSSGTTSASRFRRSGIPATSASGTTSASSSTRSSGIRSSRPPGAPTPRGSAPATSATTIPTSPLADEFVIGVFGGSVAANVFQSMDDHASEIQEALAAGALGKGVRARHDPELHPGRLQAADLVPRVPLLPEHGGRGLLRRGLQRDPPAAGESRTGTPR